MSKGPVEVCNEIQEGGSLAVRRADAVHCLKALAPQALQVDGSDEEASLSQI